MENSKDKKATRFIVGGFFALAIAVGAFALGTSNQDKSFDQSTIDWGEQRYAEMEGEVEERDALIEDMSLTFDKIDANLEKIRETEAGLREIQAGQETMGSREDRIVQDIQTINGLLATNRAELERLNKRLRKSGMQVKSLNDRIAALEEKNSTQEEAIAALSEDLIRKNERIALMSDTLFIQETVISLQDSQLMENQGMMAIQDRELHEAYFTTGTYKELRDRGLVEKKGDILGLGGKKTFTAKAPNEEFVQIDFREHNEIPVFAKKVELVTPHPEGSFELSENEDGVVETIEIIDPDSFWKTSRYLVVATNQ